MPWKSLLVAQPFQLIARTRREACQGQAVEAESKRREFADQDDACGDRACRGREMQASAICPCPAQPSAEIARVDFVVQLQCAEQSVELEAENWRLCSTT